MGAKDFNSLSFHTLAILNRFLCEARLRELNEEQVSDAAGGDQKKADDEKAEQNEAHGGAVVLSINSKVTRHDAP